MTVWRESTLLFGYARTPLASRVPDWHTNPLTGQRAFDVDQPWWSIPDFDPTVGDIKGIWELSRFEWVLAFAQRARCGEASALDGLNRWLTDWVQQNPPYCGPNWKCGQEASIRVMHLAMGQIILGHGRDATEGMHQLVAAHLQRIAPTTSYAIGQSNNHGTSEAAALFIGGSWLNGPYRRTAERGRAMLEERINTLLQDDGSFSQYSVNYHRLVLDTICMVEIWRRTTRERPFTPGFYRRAAAASEWMRRMTNPFNGDAPNIGANDGAKLLRLSDAEYRDFRDTVQLSSLLFQGGRAFQAGPWDAASDWLGISNVAPLLPPAISDAGADGGFAVMRRGSAFAVLRYPRFRYRPSQSDLLHLDFWIDGDNLLRDGGTYSYNTDAHWQEYFGGVRSHNTVAFDNRDQMPRIGRFLFAGWPTARIISPLKEHSGEVKIAVAYQDVRGAKHERRVELADGKLHVEDRISGFDRMAVLRWRLRPGQWQLENGSATDGHIRLHVSSSSPPTRFEIVEGWESRRYLEIVKIPVLEVEVQASAVITTACTWSQ